MSIFRRPDYQSEATQFINQMKTQSLTGRPAQQDRPRAAVGQNVKRCGEDYRAGRVAQKSYVYYAYSPANQQ